MHIHENTHIKIFQRIFKIQGKTRKVFFIKEIHNFQNILLIHLQNSMLRPNQCIIFERKREVKFFIFPKTFFVIYFSKYDNSVSFHLLTQVQRPLFSLFSFSHVDLLKKHSNNLCQKLHFHLHWLRYLQSIAWLIAIILELFLHICFISILCVSVHESRSAAAAAAKSLQSRPTLCDPRNSSLPGSPVPGILQARTLEWVAISFSLMLICKAPIPK